MQSQIDSGGRLAGLASCRVQPIDGAHRLGRRVEGLAGNPFPGYVAEREDRQHAIAEKLKYLLAARAYRRGQRLEDLVEQFDNHWSRGDVSCGCEATYVGIPQHSAYALDRAALDPAGMYTLSCIGAEIGCEEA
jgi:hypothetical protein